MTIGIDSPNLGSSMLLIDEGLILPPLYPIAGLTVTPVSPTSYEHYSGAESPQRS